MTQRMGVGFAVLNLHINDAGKKAKELFIENFGQETWDQEMRHYEREGIMSIFDVKLDFYKAFYAIIVMLIVNGDVEVKK